MKILIVFVDMIRANRLSSFNGNITKLTPIDNVLQKIGGTLYTNCFTPGPDTPRGLATFATGIEPYQNGCDTRVKWPRYFLDKNATTIFDLFLENDYELTLFSNPNERQTGMYPSNISEMDIHNTDFNMKKYLSNIVLKDKHCVFVGIPDFHWSFEDNGYTKTAERKAYKDTEKTLDIVFDCLDVDDFDHVFLFSDHGFKLAHEIKIQPKYLLLNDDRTNILMMHRVKGQLEIICDDKLCSLADMFGAMESLLGMDVSKGISLISKEERNYVISEDHFSFIPVVNQNVEIWSVTFRDNIYIRTLGEAYLINRVKQEISVGVIDVYDVILLANSSFGKYKEEGDKIFNTQHLLLKQTNYMNGSNRVKISYFYKSLNIIFDVISSKIRSLISKD